MNNFYWTGFQIHVTLYLILTSYVELLKGDIAYADERRITGMPGGDDRAIDRLMRPWRFNELKKSLEGISQKVLTDSLRAMEKDGIITRTVYPEVPPRVEYALSDLGETMRPILDAMQEWGTNYKKTFH